MDSAESQHPTVPGGVRNSRYHKGVAQSCPQCHLTRASSAQKRQLLIKLEMQSSLVCKTPG